MDMGIPVTIYPMFLSYRELAVHQKMVKILINPFNPEFTIVIFIHYKPRIAVAILDLYWMKMI